MGIRAHGRGERRKTKPPTSSRAFVDINQENRTLLVYRVYRRENLYG